MPPLHLSSTQTFPLKITHNSTLDFTQVFDKYVLIDHFAETLASKHSWSAKGYGHRRFPYNVTELGTLCCLSLKQA